MSSKLKPINLAGATVGTTGTIDFNAFPKFLPMDPSKKATIRLLNESGCGLDITFNASGNGHFMGAGGWGDFEVQGNDGNLSVVVTYVLPNPPVSTVFAIYYLPGETVPPPFTLGNSPVGIGGTIQTSSVQTLSNETNAAKTLVIDVGLTTATLLYQLFSDGSGTWSVISGGAAHTVLQVSALANQLKLGQAGDTSEILGSMSVDQNATITGTLSVGTVTFTNGALMTGGDLTLGPHNIVSAGNITFSGTATGVFSGTYTSGGYNQTAGDITMNNHNVNSVGTLTVNTLINLVTGTLKSLTTASGTGNGTSNTALVNPSAIVTDCCTLSGSTQTMGATRTSTTTITTNSGLGWSYIAYLQ